MSTKAKSIIALVIVSFGYALLSLAVRFMDVAMGPFAQSAARIFLGFIIGLVIFHCKINFKKYKTTSIKDWLAMILMGTVGYSVMVFFITQGVRNAKLVNVSVMYATVSLFVYFFGLIVFRRKFNTKVLILILISLYGIAVLATKSLIPAFESFGIGEFYILLSALCGSWFYLGRKMLSKHLNDQEISVAVLAIAAFSSVATTFIVSDRIDWSLMIAPLVLIGLLIGSTFNVVATYFENYAFKNLNEVTGSQILLSENIFTFIIGYIFFGEMFGWVELIGAMIIILTVYKINRIIQ